MPYASPEDRRAYAREYARKRRAIDPELSRQTNRKSYERAVADPERKSRRQERGKLFRQANPEYSQQKSAEWHKNNRERTLLKSAKKRAKQSGLPFDIDLSDIVIPEICPIFGTPIRSPSLDRVVNPLGYVKGNVRVVDRESNRMKSNISLEQAKLLVRYIEEHTSGTS